MLRSVAVILQEPVALFEFGVLTEVFGIDRTDDGVPAFDFRVCSERPGEPLRVGGGGVGGGGVGVVAPLALEAAEGADLVCVPASSAASRPSDAVVALLQAANDRGAHLLSVCSGAFTLAAAGLLDGRDCTTHWRHTDELAALAPAARIDPDVLYAHDGNIITSAGTAAGIDACLHLVRRELGAAVANRIARRMVVPPHRDGGQRQFIERPVPTTQADSLGPTLEWMLEHLEDTHTVADLARRAHLSARTFARRFVAETGTTPHQWLTDQRLLRAKELLEGSDLSVDQIASQVGFGTAAMFRHHFVGCTGLTPTAFRRRNALSA